MITWESKKEQIFEMPTGGAAIMRQVGAVLRAGPGGSPLAACCQGVSLHGLDLPGWGATAGVQLAWGVAACRERKYLGAGQRHLHGCLTHVGQPLQCSRFVCPAAGP